MSKADAWRLFIETSTRMSVAADDQLRADAQLSLADYHVLLLLLEAPDRRLRMKEIAQKMVFSPSRLTYQVDRLCRRGWLRREPVPGDRRGSYAIATDEGAAAFRAAAVGHVALVRNTFYDALTDDEATTLARIMTRVSASLDRWER